MTSQDELNERQLYREEMLALMCGSENPTLRQLADAEILTESHIQACKARQEREANGRST